MVMFFERSDACAHAEKSPEPLVLRDSTLENHKSVTPRLDLNRPCNHADTSNSFISGHALVAYCMQELTARVIRDEEPESQ